MDNKFRRKTGVKCVFDGGYEIVASKLFSCASWCNFPLDECRIANIEHRIDIRSCISTRSDVPPKKRFAAQYVRCGVQDTFKRSIQSASFFNDASTHRRNEQIQHSKSQGEIKTGLLISEPYVPKYLYLQHFTSFINFKHYGALR